MMWPFKKAKQKLQPAPYKPWLLVGNASDIRLRAIVRSSILAYKEGMNGESYHPGYTEHERMAWEIGQAEVERERKP